LPLFAASAACGAFLAGIWAEQADARQYRRPIFQRPSPAFFRPPPRVRFHTAARPEISHTAKSKKDAGPPPPPGPHHLVVSIKTQSVALYSNGNLVARSPVSTGTPDFPTPTGVFSIIQRNKDHRSNIYGGAPMPFMQRLTWSGVALHQGNLPGRPASHGCIRLPGDFAQFLWRTTKIGARVVVARDEIAPVEISHARLFQPRPAATAEVAPELRKSIDLTPASNVKTAEMTLTASDVSSAERLAATPAAQTGDVPEPILESLIDTLEAKARKPAPKGTISVFISRKEKKLFVRQGYEPLFSAPVTIRDEAAIVGNHVFTALEPNEGQTGLRWLALTLPPEAPAPERKKARSEAKPAPVTYRYDNRGRRIAVPTAKPAEPPAPPPPAPSAAEVLDRIELPQELADRISEYVGVGASLIISDYGLGYETGRYTDFIVVTRS
jgi:hypothetical protein